MTPAWTAPVEKEDRCCSHSRHAWCWHPQGDPAPQDSPACRQKTEDHRAQEAGAHGGVGAGGGPSGLSVDERERGSPGSPSEMSLSLPGPRANLSLRGPRPFPCRLKSEMNLSEQFTRGRPSQLNGLSLTSCCNLSVNSLQLYVLFLEIILHSYVYYFYLHIAAMLNLRKIFWASCCSL